MLESQREGRANKNNLTFCGLFLLKVEP